MKILCAVDFTPRSQAAAQVAVDLARRTAGSVELVHVTGPRAGDILAVAADSVVLEEKVGADVAARLAAECDRLAAQGVPITAHVCDGEIEASILKRAQAIEAELIVVGAHSRSALRRFLFGSFGDDAITIANRPILLVPPGVERIVGAGGGEGRVRLTVALDGRAGGGASIAFARELSSHTPCDVTLLRLYWAPEEYLRLGLSGPRDLFEPDADVVADLERQVRLSVGFFPDTANVSIVVEPAWGDPATKILDFARKRGADLVIAGAESRHGLARIKHPAVAAKLAHESSGIPLVLVPQKEGSAPGKIVPAVHSVLAPTDLSPASNRAIPFAYSMVAAQGGIVELCYVHERVLAAPGYAYERTEGKLTAEERTRLEGRLRELIPREAEERGITTHVTVVDGGRAGEAIVQAAERLVVDAIVMASHGKGGALRSILGSVSHTVVDTSRRPVLVIPSLDR
jgi:nucleotide-binding universal stress UspA family protein